MQQDSRFYLGDLVLVPTGETREVVGIWLKDCYDRQERWRYRLKGLTRCGASWWQESQLKKVRTPLTCTHTRSFPGLDACSISAGTNEYNDLMRSYGGLLNEFQQQAIRDFRHAVYELLEELDNHASIELETVETLMEELLETWETMKAQLADEEEP
jgi:hypothetical protein